jgi:hypothetical protein
MRRLVLILLLGAGALAQETEPLRGGPSPEGGAGASEGAGAPPAAAASSPSGAAAAPPTGPADASLLERRAWKGVIEAKAKGRNPGVTRGEETQCERIEFLLVTEPPRRSIAWPRLKLAMREGHGGYELAIDVREGDGDAAISTRGEAAGELHPRVDGYVEPTTGKWKLLVEISPGTIAPVATLSGLWEGRFVTWRTALRRVPLLAAFEEEGDLGDEGRVIVGEKTFVDKRGGVVRDVEVTWRIERLDPAVRGRVRDHLGRPVEGLKILARYQNAQRLRQRLPPLLREGRTDGAGRFRIDAFHGAWAVELVGEEREGIVLAGRVLDELVQVRFDDVPDLDLRIDAYRLDALPYARLLAGHFQGDVGAFLAHVRERVAPELLEGALAEPEAAQAD